MTSARFSPAEKPSHTKKARPAATKSRSPPGYVPVSPALLFSRGSTPVYTPTASYRPVSPALPPKKLRPRESATGGISKIRNGSTISGGSDPIHAKILSWGEPTHWTATRAYEDSRRRPYDAVPSIEPPDPESYGALPESPVQVTSGVDVNLDPITSGEFWSALEEAWEESFEHDGYLWEAEGVEKRDVGRVLWDEREAEEDAEEERQEVELLRKIHEVESLGG